MARRIEVLVPNSHVEDVRSIIADPDKCNISPGSASLAVVTEVPCLNETMFRVTVPGKNVPIVLKNLEKRNIGVTIGSVSLTSLDCFKPRFVRHTPRPDLPMDPRNKGEQSSGDSATSPRGIRRRASIMDTIQLYTDESSFRDFRKPPLTLDEVYGIIVTGSHMTTTSWINLIGASVVGAGGAATNNVVFVVAAMLVSPIMGPVLGCTFAYRVADWKLLNHAFKNLVYQTVAAWSVGFVITIPLGLYNLEDGNSWEPDPETINAFADVTNLIFSSIVACAAGIILGNAILKTTGGNSLIGIAITAGLLPPVVFSGMQLSFGLFHAPEGDDNEPVDDDAPHSREDYLRNSKFTILAYFVHLLCIGLFSNLIFFLKDVNPNFRELDDIKIEDAPGQVKQRMDLKALGVEPHTMNSSWCTKLTPQFMLGFTQRVKRASAISKPEDGHDLTGEIAGSSQMNKLPFDTVDDENPPRRTKLFDTVDDENPPRRTKLPFDTIEEDDVENALHIGHPNESD